ncbi:transcription factor SOX-6-like isoform X1 [Tachysurus ichikawai]
MQPILPSETQIFFMKSSDCVEDTMAERDPAAQRLFLLLEAIDVLPRLSLRVILFNKALSQADSPNWRPGLNFLAVSQCAVLDKIEKRPADSFVRADVWAGCRGWVQASPQELCWHLPQPFIVSTCDNYPVQFIPSTMAAAAASGLNPLQLQVCTVTKECNGAEPSPQHLASGEPAVC